MGEVSALIEGGKATAGAPLGPALGPLGVNIGEVVAKINEKTKSYAGMKVPVTVEVESNGSYQIRVGSPPTSALILKELGAKKGGANQKTDNAGNLSMEQVKSLAEMKIDALTSTTLYSAAREIIGTCNSMSVSIDGKNAKEIQKDFKAGKYNSFFGVSLGEETKGKLSDAVENIVDELKEAVEDTAEKLHMDEIVEKAEKVAEVIAEKAEEAVEEIKEAVSEPEEAKGESVKEPKKEAKEEAPAEPQKSESYSQHMAKIEKEAGVKKPIEVSEDKPKEKVETEVVKSDSNTEIIRPKKAEK